MSFIDQVIKGCSAGQFEGGIPFERFDCANRDVCFRIDRLVTDGYLHRYDEHPQIILYQPSTVELSSNSQSVSHVISIQMIVVVILSRACMIPGEPYQFVVSVP